MDDSTLDLWLEHARPAHPANAVLSQLAVEASREAQTVAERRRGLTIGALIAACVAGVVSLGLGTAAAVPGIAHWWLWMPDDEITIVNTVELTGPEQTNPGTYTCTTFVKVLTDGKTADETTTQNLYDARLWLQSVDLADYEDAAEEHMSAFSSSLPEELRRAGALAMAITIAYPKQGFNRAGVAIDSGTECDPVEG